MSPANRFSIAITDVPCATKAVESTRAPPAYSFSQTESALLMSRVCDHLTGFASSAPVSDTCSSMRPNAASLPFSVRRPAR